VQTGPHEVDQLEGEFLGRRGRIFGLALRTGFFTILTLGIYRFWMKTRLRRWYWSSIRIGGLPLEYVGDPIEKLLGFLIAVVILAFYIGVVNLLLMFASFSLFQGNFAAYLASFVGVIPIWFYAQYRARRYVLARTRWRGLRFGLEPGAWGYAIRALGHWTLTLLTVGILWPRMTYYLEKYKTDRTSWGTGRLSQGGRWQMLFPSTKWVVVGLFLIIVGVTPFAMHIYENRHGIYRWDTEYDRLALPFFIGVIGFILLIFGIFYYRVDSLRRLTATKDMNGVGLTLKARPMRIFGIHFWGYTLASLALFVPLVMIMVVIGFAMAGLIGAEDMGVDLDWLSTLDRWVLIVINIGLYFAAFLMWSVFTQTFITFPLMRHYAETLTLQNPEALLTVQQRPRDEHIEAEGFAEALDVGASI
jgi:uncharacterized membrane protein YjgN (DUF898 family)